MNIFHKMHRLRSLTILFAALATSTQVSFQAHAALGEDVNTVASDQVRMEAKLQILTRGRYAIHELQMPIGSKVREFVPSTAPSQPVAVQLLPDQAAVIQTTDTSGGSQQYWVSPASPSS
jgi:hypothetical protein